jgi:hypothetical protein
MSKTTFGITKEFLEEQHLKRGLSPKEIAENVGCTHDLILHYLKKFGITKLPRYKRINGKRFGKLVAEEFIKLGSEGAIWQCRCDCGNIITATAGKLGSGHTKSCGCLLKETLFRHGLSNTRPYNIWSGMKRRCDNPKEQAYQWYGGRGISYDPRWKDFTTFWDDMKNEYGDTLTLERIDGNKNYSKDNCTWVTHQKQHFNKRSNVCLTFQGERKTITEWAAALNIDRHHLYYLHESGMSDDEIFKEIQRRVAG